MTISEVKGKKVIITGQKQDRDTVDGTIEILLLFCFLPPADLILVLAIFPFPY